MDISIPSFALSIHPAILIGLLGGYIAFSIWIIFAMQFSNLMSLKTSADWKSDLQWYVLFFPGTVVLLSFLVLSKIMIKLVGPKKNNENT
jgi:hypothetical protein